MYIHTRKKKKDRNTIESNTLNSINLFFFFEIHRKNHLRFSFYSYSVLRTTNIYSSMTTNGLTCHRLEEGRRIMCLKMNDLQLWLTSFSLDQRQYIYNSGNMSFAVEHLGLLIQSQF